MARTTILLATGAALAVAACGSGGGAKEATAGPAVPSASPSPSAAPYKPVIDPAGFGKKITNRYFPLRPGMTLVYEGTRDGKPQRAEVVVTNETRTIMGVPCVVVRDTVTSDGALVEKTTDWYSQAANGDVWYFGEDTKEYTNGAVSSTKGSWEAGVDGAQPGVIMKAAPAVGESYRQEYRPGEAEDMAKVLRTTASIKVPVGSYTHVVVTDDTDPLNPDKSDQKEYAPGVGLVHAKRVRSGHQEEISLTKRTGG